MVDDASKPIWGASTRRRLVWRIAAALALVVLVVVWVVMFRPQSLGGPVQYSGVSGTSMEPALHAGDLTLAVRDAGYQEGDIVVFHVSAGQPDAGLTVIHRIAGGNGSTGFVTKGDNNPGTDPWHPTNADVVGRVWIVVPGKVRWAILAVVGVLLVLLVVAAWPSRRRRPPTIVPAGPTPAAAGERVRRTSGAGSPGLPQPTAPPPADPVPAETTVPTSVMPAAEPPAAGTSEGDEVEPTRPDTSDAGDSYWTRSSAGAPGAEQTKRRFRRPRGSA